MDKLRELSAKSTAARIIKPGNNYATGRAERLMPIHKHILNQIEDRYGNSVRQMECELNYGCVVMSSFRACVRK